MLTDLFDELHSHTFVVIFDFIERKEVFFFLIYIEKAIL